MSFYNYIFIVIYLSKIHQDWSATNFDCVGFESYETA